MRCAFRTCRGRLAEYTDRLGRVTFVCEQCERRTRGICQLCPRPVYGTVGMAFYCNDCKVKRKRKDVMRWQKNNLNRVALGARKRRWKEKGERMPDRPMTRSEAGKIGGKLGAAARVKSLGAERVKEIAKKANAIRWKKYYERKRLEEAKRGEDGNVL